MRVLVMRPGAFYGTDAPGQGATGATESRSDPVAPSIPLQSHRSEGATGAPEATAKTNGSRPDVQPAPEPPFSAYHQQTGFIGAEGGSPVVPLLLGHQDAAQGATGGAVAPS